MSSKRELIWHITGSVTETIYNLGNRNKPYWQVIIETDDGYVCLYARNDVVRPIAEGLAVGEKIAASGKVRPHKSVAAAKRPLFLDPVEHLSPIDYSNQRFFVGMEHQRSSRQIQIDDILSLEREPALEAWKKFELDGDDVRVAEELGYPIKYFRKLFAQDFVFRLSSGESFTEFPQLTSELEFVCWNTVVVKVKSSWPSKIDTPLCIQFRLNLLSLHRSDVPTRDLVKKFGLGKYQVTALLMLALAEEGLTLNEIGDEFGLTRERARQVLKTFGVSTRDIKKELEVQEKINRERMSQAIDSWITSHPGCTVSEVSDAMMISESDVMSLCPQDTQGLLLGTRKKRAAENYRTYSKTQILDALRHAFDLRNPSMSMYSVSDTLPLTGPHYDKLRSEGVVQGPSQARIIQVFGTWKAACEEAGVPYVEAVRDFYGHRWTDDELIGQLAEFISKSKSRSVASFDAWSRLDTSRASFGTIRNQIGEWSESYDLALQQLRRQWTSN